MLLPIVRALGVISSFPNLFLPMVDIDLVQGLLSQLWKSNKYCLQFVNKSIRALKRETILAIANISASSAKNAELLLNHGYLTAVPILLTSEDSHTKKEVFYVFTLK